MDQILANSIYDQVIAWIPERSRVLDLGTGDGAFLERLIREKKVSGEGVEINNELMARCIERGLIVHQGDILDGLDQYGLSAFDYVLLLGTFEELQYPQRILEEAFRVGDNVIISYHNASHWRIRREYVFTGHVPRLSMAGEPWYRSPTVHYLTILDFQQFCRDLNLREVKSAYFNHAGRIRYRPNLRAECALSLLRLNGED